MMVVDALEGVLMLLLAWRRALDLGSFASASRVFVDEGVCVPWEKDEENRNCNGLEEIACRIRSESG